MLVLSNVVKSVKQSQGSNSRTSQLDEKDIVTRIQKMSSLKDLLFNLRNFFDISMCDLRRYRAVLDCDRVLRICTRE